MKGKFRLALRANGTYSVTNPLDGTTNGRLAALPGPRTGRTRSLAWVVWSGR